MYIIEDHQYSTSKLRVRKSKFRVKIKTGYQGIDVNDYNSMGDSERVLRAIEIRSTRNHFPSMHRFVKQAFFSHN